MGILIKGGHLINPATGIDGRMDVYIDGGKVAKVDSEILQTELSSNDKLEIIDADDKYILPGIIDMHVHLRDPGATHKEDVHTASDAAARGGVTTMCAMPNTIPPVDSVDTFSYITSKADTYAKSKVYQLASVTKGMKGEELIDFKALKDAGCIAISEDGKSVMDEALYDEAMKIAADLDLIVMAHCEDADLVRGGVVNEGVASEKYGVNGITNEVENKIIRRDAEIAKKYGTRLHICHCSTKESPEIIAAAKSAGAKVSGEVCPHHFILMDADITADDGKFKMNPPLRTKADVDALIDGLKSGAIDVISTDHAPHAPEEKGKGLANSAFGIVGLETSFALSYTYLVKAGHLSLSELVEKMSLKPAELLGIDRGDISEGMPADVLIVDLDNEYTINGDEFVGKNHNMPYDGMKVFGRVETTIKDGNVVYSR